MGITSKKQEDIPAPAFGTVPVHDNAKRDPKTGVGIPTEEAVLETKAWMNINKQ